MASNNKSCRRIRPKQSLKEFHESLESSATSYPDDDRDESAYFNKKNNDTIQLQSFLRSRFNNSTSADTMPIRQKGPRQMGVNHLENAENLDPADLITGLKNTVHSLQKKDACLRLEVSKLKKQLAALASDHAQLLDDLRVKCMQAQRDNEYILRLDAQLRLHKDELSRGGKSKSSVMCLKLTRLEQENEQMKFVIKELLEEIQGLKVSKRDNSQEHFEDVEKIIRNSNTYPSSQSDRGQPMHPWQMTMNPHGNKQHGCGLDDMLSNHLSTIDEGPGQSNASGFVRQSVGGMASLSYMSNYSRSRFSNDD